MIALFAFGAAFATRVAGRPALRMRHDLAFGQELEAKRAGDRGGFDQLDGDTVAQPMSFAAATADHGVPRLFVTEVVVADGAGWNEAVGAGAVELDEQAGARDAGNAAFEGRADPVGEMMRNQPVGGFALSLHGAPLGSRNLRRDLGQ